MMGKYSIAFRKSLESILKEYETPEEPIDEYTNRIAAKKAVESASKSVTIGSHIPVVEKYPRSEYWKQMRANLSQSYKDS